MEKMTTPQRIIFRITVIAILLLCARFTYIYKKQNRLERERKEEMKPQLNTPQLAID